MCVKIMVYFSNNRSGQINLSHTHSFIRSIKALQLFHSAIVHIYMQYMSLNSMGSLHHNWPTLMQSAHLKGLWAFVKVVLFLLKLAY